MAKSGIGLMIARAAPPPGKLGRGAPPPATGGDEPDGDEGGEYDGDDDKAAETSAASRVADALGIKGADAEELCEALKDFIATIKA